MCRVTVIFTCSWAGLSVFDGAEDFSLDEILMVEWLFWLKLFKDSKLVVSVGLNTGWRGFGLCIGLFQVSLTVCDRVTVTSEAGLGSRPDDFSAGFGEKELVKFDSKSIVRPFVPNFRNLESKRESDFTFDDLFKKRNGILTLHLWNRRGWLRFDVVEFFSLIVWKNDKRFDKIKIEPSIDENALSLEEYSSTIGFGATNSSACFLNLFNKTRSWMSCGLMKISLLSCSLKPSSGLTLFSISTFLFGLGVRGMPGGFKNLSITHEMILTSSAKNGGLEKLAKGFARQKVKISQN